MARRSWKDRILGLAYDFRLDIAKAEQIVCEVDGCKVPKGKAEAEYKYCKAWEKLRPLIMQI